MLYIKINDAFTVIVQKYKIQFGSNLYTYYIFHLLNVIFFLFSL